MNYIINLRGDKLYQIATPAKMHTNKCKILQHSGYVPQTCIQHTINPPPSGCIRGKEMETHNLTSTMTNHIKISCTINFQATIFANLLLLQTAFTRYIPPTPPTPPPTCHVNIPIHCKPRGRGAKKHLERTMTKRMTEQVEIRQ